MSEVHLRQWTILSNVPRLPSSVSTRQLVGILFENGFDVKKRTVERDLETLSANFPITYKVESARYHWYWLNDKLFDIPAMSANTALTLSFVSDYLTPFFPKSSLEYMQPYFDCANNVLASYGSSTLKAWKNKVRVVNKGLSLKPCETNSKVFNVVYDALLQDKKFHVSYNSREDFLKEYQVNPLGLVFKESVTYLVCTLKDYQDIRQLALHRIQSANIMEDKRKVPKGFNLDDYISTGNFSYTVKQEPIKIQLKFDSYAAKHLLETKLSDDQKIIEQSDDFIQLSATVIDTQELRWWILGFGDQVEVIKPKRLRKEFTEISENMHKTYFTES